MSRDPLQRMRAVDRRHPVAWDVGLAVLVAAVSFVARPVPLLGLDGAAFLAVHVAVAFRRRRPLAALVTALAGVALAAGAALVTGAASPWTFLAVWVLLFGAGLRDDRRRTRIAAATLLAVTAVAAAVAPPSAVALSPGERITLVMAVVGMSAASFLLGLQLRGRRERRTAEQAEIARAAAVAERARIAQEMHDVIGHNLSVITSLAAGGAVAVHQSPDDAVRAFEAIGEVSRSSVREVRGVLRVLRHDATTEGAPLRPQPGLSDLPALLESVRAAGGDVVLQREADLRGLDAGRQLAVYRIVQESLTNVLRHGGPEARATVRIVREADAVVVTVTDTGAGGDAPGEAGHGLVGMRERVEAYGGDVEAGPTPGGWRVHARIPAERAARVKEMVR